ncbi:MAG TPA: ATPase, T2SS/T4P/T4SS family [Phycisphaerae bacterium]|nr:ATPase, T2SS/T4P/T4SS family [Phycisphaerae bacterium]
MDAVTSNIAESAEHNGRTNASDNRAVSEAYVTRIPIAFARRHNIIGLEPDEHGTMPLLAAPPVDVNIIDNVSIRLGLPVRVVETPSEEAQRHINSAYSAQDSGVELAIDAAGNGESIRHLNALGTGNDLLDHSGSAPVIKIVNMVLLEAIKRRASDVHIQPFAKHVQIRLRIDGVLYDYVQPPLHLLDEIVSRIKIIGCMDIAEKRLPQDGRTTVSIGERVVDLRISSLPSSCGERVVIRLLDKSARLYSLSEIGMEDDVRDAFVKAVRRSHGIVLVTGPTGSGKSTTLYAVLQELNAKELNILTLEDPIEYELTGISQTQVSAKKGMTFASGLRTVLRQDPDVIMVGEIRDEETARMAVQSALTGHLVLSTLHTNDAAGAVTRLLDLGIEPYLVASSLLAVLAQRLVRRACTGCKQMAPLSDPEIFALNVNPHVHASLHVASCTGCDSCMSTGYFERVGIFEMLHVTDTVRRLIVQRGEAAAIKEAAIKEGMKTLRQDAIDKLFAGETTVTEVNRVTQASQDDVDEAHATPTGVDG